MEMAIEVKGLRKSFKETELYIVHGSALEQGFDTNSSKGSSLLQNARGTLPQSRFPHLSFILTTLYEHGIEMAKFLEMRVPIKFSTSVLQQRVSKIHELSCIAPWCANYKAPGTLVKTGTSSPLLLQKLQGGLYITSWYLMVSIWVSQPKNPLERFMV
jgi:hypothetical protein